MCTFCPILNLPCFSLQFSNHSWGGVIYIGKATACELVLYNNNGYMCSFPPRKDVTCSVPRLNLRIADCCTLPWLDLSVVSFSVLLSYISLSNQPWWVISRFDLQVKNTLSFFHSAANNPNSWMNSPPPCPWSSSAMGETGQVRGWSRTCVHSKCTCHEEPNPIQFSSACAASM